jgi:hypothetical protein
MRRSAVTLYATRVSYRLASLRTRYIGAVGLSGGRQLSQAIRQRSRRLLCPQAWQLAITARTPFLRMLAKVIGGPCFARGPIPAAHAGCRIMSVIGS